MADTEPVTRIAAAGESIIDTHHHLWDLGRFRYDWLAGDGQADVADVLGDYASIRADYLIADLLAEFVPNGVIKSVHIQADISGEDPVLETRWLQAIADEHGYPHAIVAFTDLRRPGSAAELDRHLLSANMRGIRMPEVDGLADDLSFRRGTRVLADRGLSLQLDPPPQRMDQFARLARDEPDLRLFLGHAGFPEARGPDYFETWRAAIVDVASADNVVMKISGLGMGDHHWTVDSIRPWVLEAIAVFGVDRCVFGTNWPVDRLYSDLPTLLGAYREIVAEFSRPERDALLVGNAERFYRI